MRNAAVYVPVPGGDLRKGRVVVRRVFLQEGVLFCKSTLHFFEKKNNIKMVGFQYLSRVYSEKNCACKKVHNVKIWRVRI